MLESPAVLPRIAVVLWSALASLVGDGAPAMQQRMRVVTPAEVPIDTPVVAEPEQAQEVWLPETRDCHRRGRRRFCDGPRRMRAPTGAALDRTERLGLGTRQAYWSILGGAADPALLEETPPLEAESLLWPVPRGFMGRGFGYTRTGRLADRIHRGVDIPAAEGAEVRATNAGLVVYADNQMRGYGNLVVLLHRNDTRTVYAHLSEGRVAAGEHVARGQVLGLVGETGLARAPHLHFEYRRRAVPRNPARRFVERPTGEESDALQREAAARRREGEARLAEARERAARRAERRARRAGMNRTAEP